MSDRSSRTTEPWPFDPSVKISVSQLLLTEEHLICCFRLLLATRHLTSMARALELMRASNTPKDHEPRHFVLLHLIASAKEAADRFAECDSRKLFEVLRGGGEHLVELRDAVALVRRAVSKSDGESLYRRVLQPFRNKAGFHIDRNAMIGSLRELQHQRFNAFEVDATSGVLSIPLVTMLMANMTWSQIQPRPTESEVVTLIDEVFEFSTQIRNVAHDYYLLIVKLSTLEVPKSARATDEAEQE